MEGKKKSMLKKSLQKVNKILQQLQINEEENVFIFCRTVFSLQLLNQNLNILNYL